MEGDCSYITEYEPAMLDNSNTEVKIPVNAGALSSHVSSPTMVDDDYDAGNLSDFNLSAPTAGQVHTNSSSVDVCTSGSPDVTAQQRRSNLIDIQLNQLVVYFNGFPRDMFKDALLKLYASCNKKLNQVRYDLFAIVSSMNGFPNKNACLRRRLQTRNGDTIAAKLAYDIQTLRQLWKVEISVALT